MQNAAAPLIWTTKGNVPVESVRYETKWFVSNERIEFIETYFDGEEIVRQNVHISILKGEEIIPTQAKL